MNIKKVKIKDIENNLLNLYIDGFYYHYNGRPDVFIEKNATELEEDLIKMVKSGDMYVIEDNEKIIGYVAYQFKEVRAKVLWIDELMIDGEYRHLGFGKKLIKVMEKLAKEEGCKRVELCCWSFNQNAMDMYKHLGYKEQRSILELEVK